MILDEWVEVSWRNCYAELGYTKPKGTTKLMVRPTDMSPNSSVQVLMACDRCGKQSYQARQVHTIAMARRGEYRCQECYGRDKQKSIEELQQAFVGRELIPRFTERKNAKDKLAYECPKHLGIIQYISPANFSAGKGCGLCGKALRLARQKATVKKRLDEEGKKGETIMRYLRRSADPWRDASFAHFGDQCLFTGFSGKGVTIHHLEVPFNKIIAEVFKELNITRKRRKHVCDYTEDELARLVELNLKKHFEYGLGVPMHHRVHWYFHTQYGFYNTTFEDYQDFFYNHLNKLFRIHFHYYQDYYMEQIYYDHQEYKDWPD